MEPGWGDWWGAIGRGGTLAATCTCTCLTPMLGNAAAAPLEMGFVTTMWGFVTTMWGGPYPPPDCTLMARAAVAEAPVSTTNEVPPTLVTVGRSNLGILCGGCVCYYYY